MKSKEHIFSHVQGSLPLPSLPHILIKLIDTCDDEDAPISAVAPLIAKDTALSSKVLRLVNSAYFGLHRTFSNLEQAVALNPGNKPAQKYLHQLKQKAGDEG